MARLTTKPIARGKAKWQAEVDGVEKFIRELKAMPPHPLMATWRRKMLKYYSRRLSDLKAHPPRPRRRK